MSVADGIAHAFRKPVEFDHARAMVDRLSRDYGYDRIEVLDRDAFRALVPSDAYAAGELDHGAGHLHPLNLVIGMARLADAAGARIRELSHVHHIRHARKPGEKSVVQTGKGRVICDHVILAANGYLAISTPMSPPASCRSTILSSRPNPWRARGRGAD